MQKTIQGLKRSSSVKALVIGGLILVLLIPVSMIKGVVHDRESVRQQARHDITRSWGNAQLIAGPVLIVPFTLRHLNSNGREIIEESRLYLLPESLNLVTSVNPEVRYRGLHKVPIYNAAIAIDGEFNSPNLEMLGIEAARIHWDKASVAVFVSDARAITETPIIDINDKTAKFEAGGQEFFGDMPPPIIAPVGGLIKSTAAKRTVRFSMTLHVNGSASLRFTPLGDTTRVSMSSNWSSPSFLGNYLPKSRQVTDDGFTADWQIASLGRALPWQWTDRLRPVAQANQTAFGVSFYIPVSLYQLTLRAIKYAVLFIGLSFVAYFLIEIMANLRLHPLQYLLVGFSNAMFYLLLLSLAEHIGFGWAYLVSAAASAGLITGYSVAVLNGSRRGLIMAIILTGLYGFLYMTLNAESYALLAGAIGLWVALAVVMYLTRRIDWYAQGNTATDQ